MAEVRQRLARRGDGGQVATTVMIIVTVALVTVVTYGTLGLGGAAAERSQAQTAADAAALGGAEEIREELVQILAGLGDPGDLFAGGCRGTGQAGAADFAGRNRANLTAYCWDRVADRVRVEVRNDDTLKGQPAEAEADASLGFGPGECEWDEQDPAPTPSPSATPDPDAPPPDGLLELRCGGLRLEFSVDGETGDLTLLTTPDEVRDQLENYLEPSLER